MSGDYDALVERARAQGFTVEKRGIHWRATPPDRTKPIVHFSASRERHAYRNTIADLKRAGFVDRARPPPPPPLPDVPALGDDPTKPETFAPKEIPMPAPEPKTLDTVYTNLREARIFVGLAADDVAKVDEELAAAEKAVAAVRAKRANAERLLLRANEDLERARSAFDGAFAAERL